MKLKPYPKYKDSGIQWIGRIPEEWEVHKLKYLLSTLESGSRETGGGSQLDEGVFSLGGEHINWDGTLNLENTKLISEEYYNSMNQGKPKINDILLVKDGATIGKTAILTKKEFDKMAVNEHVFLMRSNKRINPKLLYYLICSDSGFKQIKLTEVGSAQGGINQDFIAKAYFSITQDKQDQTAIANFLDKKTAKGNALIEKDKKLIALLKEKRTALINHAVTKGLDPDVKLKDSGVEWIGEIPEGWEVRKLKHELNFYDYKRIPLSAEERGLMTERIYDYYGASGIIDKVEDYIFNGTYILLGEDGANLQLRSTPLAFLASGKFWVNNHAHILKPINGNIDFFVNLLESMDYSIFVTGSAQPKLTADNLKNITLPVPPKSEQLQIASFLDSKTAKIDKTIQKIEEKIKLLEEYKKSLIHHTVTGKMDVRGVEA